MKSMYCVLLMLFYAVNAIDYCKLCKKDSHTLCRYKEGPADSCLDYRKPDLPVNVKKYIVDIHNDIRNHVASGQETRGGLGRQPAASNMNVLQWDNELAEIAQRWADQCVDLNEEFQHDQCRKTVRFDVGQNILTAITSTQDLPEIAILILNWYKQVENVLPSDIETFSGIQRGKFIIGQYTQLVWAETSFVGCGLATFRNKNMSDPKAKFLHRLVCNYGPRGNLIGTSVYDRGIPCTKCPYGRCDSVRTSLCQSFNETHISTGAAHTEENPVPVTLFNTLSLGYILKNNLSHLMNVWHDAQVYNDNKDFKLEPTANLNEIVDESNVDRNTLKKTSNILYHSGVTGSNRRMFDLDEGHVVIDECKHQMEQCQYEDDERTTMVPSEQNIVLPNNMVYRKIEGIWFHGRCRCNYVYRSRASFIKNIHHVTILAIIVVGLLGCACK